MNTPPIFPLLFASADVKALLGSLPLRAFEFNDAPQNVATPYLVWQVVAGNPENSLGDAPDIDGYTTQVDIYGESVSDVRAVAKAVVKSIEGSCYVTSWYGESTEPDTQLKRFSFAADWFTKRD